MDLMNVAWSFLGFFLGGFVFSAFFILVNPYLRARLLSLMTGKTRAVAEMEGNNAEIQAKIFTIDDTTVSFGKRTYPVEPSAFRRKFGVPSTHYHHSSVKPSTFRGEDIIRTVQLIPARVKAVIEQEFEVGKGKKETITKEVFLDGEKLVPIPRMIKNEKGEEVRQEWLIANTGEERLTPPFNPKQLAAFMQAELAYSITNAMIQKQEDIEKSKLYSMIAMLLSGVTVLLVLLVLYYLFTVQSGVQNNYEILTRLNATLTK